MFQLLERRTIDRKEVDDVKELVGSSCTETVG